MAENYGHVIFEALSGGCIPVISDRTPWTEEKLNHNGKVCSLEQIEQFKDALQSYAQKSKEELLLLAKNCVQFAQEYKTSEEAYRKMFNV